MIFFMAKFKNFLNFSYFCIFLISLYLMLKKWSKEKVFFQKLNFFGFRSKTNLFEKDEKFYSFTRNTLKLF